ncbi:MAG: cache domain-containing protein [Methanoculleaceae archaeon]
MDRPIISAAVLVFLAAALISAGCTGPSADGEIAIPAPTPDHPLHTRAEMVSFVREAVDFAHNHTKATALATFSDPGGAFMQDNLYIYAYDFNGTTIAHPVNPEKIGVNRLDERDAAGNLFIRDLRDKALGGGGFVAYYYIDPAMNRTVQPKLGYVLPVDDDWWLGSGIYSVYQPDPN